MRARERTGIEYYMRAEEVDALGDLARRLGEYPVIVNIGAGLGTSACAFLEARPDATVFSVDVRECAEEAEALRACGLDPRRCVRLLGKSQDIGPAWPFMVDAVFIDGDHNGRVAQADYHAWYPRIKPGGWVAFHDYGAAMLAALAPAIDALNVPGPVIARIDTLIAWGVE